MYSFLFFIIHVTANDFFKMTIDNIRRHLLLESNFSSSINITRLENDFDDLPRELKRIMPKNIDEWVRLKNQIRRIDQFSKKYFKGNVDSYDANDLKRIILRNDPYKYSIFYLLDVQKDLDDINLESDMKRYLLHGGINLNVIISSFYDIIEADKQDKEYSSNILRISESKIEKYIESDPWENSKAQTEVERFLNILNSNFKKNNKCKVEITVDRIYSSISRSRSTINNVINTVETLKNEVIRNNKKFKIIEQINIISNHRQGIWLDDINDLSVTCKITSNMPINVFIFSTNSLAAIKDKLSKINSIFDKNNIIFNLKASLTLTRDQIYDLKEHRPKTLSYLISNYKVII